MINSYFENLASSSSVETATGAKTNNEAHQRGGIILTVLYRSTTDSTTVLWFQNDDSKVELWPVVRHDDDADNRPPYFVARLELLDDAPYE